MSIPGNPDLAAPDLASLVGSRICHDLISPIGAISNGMELLALEGGGAGPEVALIGDSVASASAKIRFFRVAFGVSGAGQRTGRGEILAILADLSKGRLKYDWQGPSEMARAEVKLAFLAMMCAETALPQGGTILFGAGEGGWQVTGRSPKVRAEGPLWDSLTGAGGPGEFNPAGVQFPLLLAEAARQGRRLAVQAGAEEIRIGF